MPTGQTKSMLEAFTLYNRPKRLKMAGKSAVTGGLPVGVKGPTGLALASVAHRPTGVERQLANRSPQCSPAGEVQIVDNWNVVGMQGTGSHDLKLHKKTVGREWTFVRGSASTIDEPLYRYPSVSYQAQVHAAVNLGLARAALDMVIAMSGSTKTVTGAPRLGDRAYYRSELGKAEAMLRSAQAFFYETADAVWASLLAGNPVTLHQANLLRLSATHAAHTCAEVVMKAYRLAGTAAIFKENRLQWIVRDSMVVTQHAFLGESTYDGAGALFAGIEPTMPYP